MDKYSMFSKVKKKYGVKTKLPYYVGNNSFNATLRFIDRMKANTSPALHDMPIFILMIPEGQGLMTAARMLAKRLEAGETDGKATIVEHYMLTPEDVSINQLGTIAEISDSIAGRRGVAASIIDLDTYAGRKIYDPLALKLMKFISDAKMVRTFFLRIAPMEKDVIRAMLDYMSNYLNVKLIEFPRLTPELALKNTSIRLLQDHGVIMDKTAGEEFKKYFERQQTKGGYFGFHTLERMRNEIMFCFSSDESTPDFIEKRHISEYSARLRGDRDDSPALLKLEKMVALGDIKEQVKEIVKSAKYKKEAGLTENRTLHLMFTGQPGTGKTAVAKLIGKIFQESGILPVGRLIEVGRKDLIGEYMGQTALKTIDVCKMAMGSVLFIDEAYSLAKMDNDRYGFEQECLTTLLAEMENNRDKFVVIMAGYKDEMEQLCRTNAGLRDRFAFKIDFPSYTREQLLEIFNFQLAERSYEITEAARAAVKSYVFGLSDQIMKDKNFSNARFIRNLTERIISKLALRVINGRSGTGEDNLIIEEDISSSVNDTDFKKMNNGKEKRLIGYQKI